MPSECDEEENRRGEGSKPNYDSPDKRPLFFFAVIAMHMPLHLNLPVQSERVQKVWELSDVAGNAPCPVGATDLVVRRVRVCVAQEHPVSVLLYLPALET